MDNFINLIQTIFYPFGYFLVLFIVYGVSRFSTMFLITTGRMKAFHAVENYWAYLLVILFCAIIGVIGGFGQTISFFRWFLSSMLAGMIGMHFGFEKGANVSDEDLQSIEDELDQLE